MILGYGFFHILHDYFDRLVSFRGPALYHSSEGLHHNFDMKAHLRECAEQGGTHQSSGCDGSSVFRAGGKHDVESYGSRLRFLSR